MAPRARPCRLSLKLTADEYGALSARATAERTSMAALVRAALASSQARAALTREDALRLLGGAAEGGSITAMVALERALRVAPPTPGATAGQADDELARLRQRLHERARARRA